MSDDEYEPMTNGGATKNGGPAVPPPKSQPQKKLTVEKIYQKKTQLEHILLRPDTYIGSVERVSELMWTMDREKGKMVQETISYVPGLYKIFDEILVNAADNKQRDPKMNSIKICIDKENNVISVENNGKGIPVVEHKDEKMFVPTMIFGHLLTSSNYNDEELKVTGGRNGYGAKLCNIFSTKFTVETSCKESGKQLKQTWINNMSKTSEPRISKCSGSDFTKITFSPDLAKFKMDELEDDIIKLMERRAYDVAASTRNVKVSLNGQGIPIKNFKEYAELYVKDENDEVDKPLKYEMLNDRWEVAIAVSDKGFQQVSFVNSIATTKGGRHVDYVVDKVVHKLLDQVKKKQTKGGMAVKPFQVKNHLFIFVNCLINNPTFDSQTKENMTLQAKNFGSKCELTEAFQKQIGKMGIVENVLVWAKFKEQAQLKKVGGKKETKLKGIAKLEDANDAGTKKSIDCTLILTEGDSAKTLAVAGLGIVGRDKYGVFPLRGKFLNVREASSKQIMENTEICALLKIVGLQVHKKYETADDLKTLRYGKIMIMTDQDQDGSHIKGLLINFLHFFWPSLLRIPFLEEFITPIVKARKGDTVLSFFSLPEFEEWKKETNNWHTYRIKYYKGLGTSDSNEAKEYFSDMERHRIKFTYEGTSDDNNILLAFAKKDVDKRKEWLANWMESCKRRQELGLPEEYLYGKTTKVITYSEFVNKELVLFSNMDNERSIPSLVDGLKPGQRKVIFTCLKRNDKREVKVAQLAGSVAEHSAYHHGEASLLGTIINLAQNFVGSNNINLLLPNGQFGTRLSGGKDAASPRYIFTMLHPVAKLIFHPDDTPLLKNLFDDNLKIEPQFYCPILPMVLVNGSEGIGTGWSTKILCYNPREIVENLRRMIHGDDPVLMIPWYKNFRGRTQVLGDTRFIFFGEVAVLGEGEIEITELPVGVWTSKYKEEVLDSMLNPAKGETEAFITDYKDYSTDTTVRFVVSMTPQNFQKAERIGLHKAFKLTNTQATSSMCLFDDQNVLRKYDTVAEILKDFFKVRSEMYKKRKNYLEGFLEAQSSKLSNQARFIVEKCNNQVVIENKKKVEMIKQLRTRGYDPDPERVWKKKQDSNAALEEEESDDAKGGDEDSADYSYLLGMSLWTLTHEKKEELLKKRDDKIQELKNLQSTSPETLWEKDLTAFLEKLDEYEKEEEEKTRKALKKPIQGVKGKGNAKDKAKKMSLADIMPDPRGRRIEPCVDDELKKKTEKLDAAKSRPPGMKGKKRKSDGGDADANDDVDLLIRGAAKSLKDRIGTSPEAIEKKTKGLKQSKLSFKKKDSPKKRTWNSDEPGGDDNMDSDMEVLPARERGPRRAAASKVNMKDLLKSDSEDGDDDDDLIFVDNNLGTEEGAAQYDSKIIVSDTDSDFDEKPKSRQKKLTGDQPKKAAQKRVSSSSENEDTVPVKPAQRAAPRQSSDQLFDNLIGNKVDSDDDHPAPTSKPRPSASTSDTDEPAKKKAPVKKRPLLKMEKPEKKKAPPKKRPKQKDESDEDIFESPGDKKHKKKEDSDSDMELSEPFQASSRSTTGRARKPVSYNFGESDESD